VADVACGCRGSDTSHTRPSIGGVCPKHNSAHRPSVHDTPGPAEGHQGLSLETLCIASQLAGNINLPIQAFPTTLPPTRSYSDIFHHGELFPASRVPRPRPVNTGCPLNGRPLTPVLLAGSASWRPGPVHLPTGAKQHEASVGGGGSGTPALFCSHRDTQNLPPPRLSLHLPPNLPSHHPAHAPFRTPRASPPSQLAAIAATSESKCLTSTTRRLPTTSRLSPCTTSAATAVSP
jgi:hypothetical protein